MRITAVAYVAIAVYPLGLIVINGVLLFYARKAIQSGKETPLSKATAFLYREYEPAFFGWEVRVTRDRATTLF